MGRTNLSPIDEKELRKILDESTEEEILEYAFKYLRQKECGRQRIKRLREKEQKNEKNKC